MERATMMMLLATCLLASPPNADSEMMIMAGRIPVDERGLSSGTDGTGLRLLDRVPHQPWLTGSSIALSPDERFVVVVDTDNRTLVISDVATGNVVHQVSLGRMPERVVVSPAGLAYVTNRGSRSVSVVDIARGQEVRSVEAGVEPWGLALSPDAKTLLVAASASGEVLLFDAGSLALQHRIETPWPVAVAAHPDGKRAYVTTMHGREVREIDIQRGRVLRTLQLPDRGTGLPGRLMGRGAVPRQANLAFAATVSPGGHRLFVTHTMVDTGDRLAAAGRVDGGYGLGGATPIVATVSTFDLDSGELSRPKVNFGGQEARIGWISRVDQVAQRMAQPMAVVHDPIRARLMMVGQGSDLILALDTRSSDPFTEPLSGYATGQAPKGVVFDRAGARLFVHNAHDYSVAIYPVDGALPGESDAGRMAMKAARSFAIGKDPLPEKAAKGRRLFTYALEPAVGGTMHFACASCHPDGRQDGMTWQVSVGPRQTPILADRVYGTGPFNWLGTETTLHENITQTVRRLGGGGITADQAAALEEYVTRYLPGLDNPQKLSRSALVAQGEQLFHSADVGCSGCHDSGSRFTDGALHEVGTTSAREKALWEKLGQEQAKRAGGPVAPQVPALREPVAQAPVAYNTPSLRHLWASAPYYHDGSAATLEELLTTGNAGDRMGRTSHLEPQQIDALVAYLQTL